METRGANQRRSTARQGTSPFGWMSPKARRLAHNMLAVLIIIVLMYSPLSSSAVVWAEDSTPAATVEASSTSTPDSDLVSTTSSDQTPAAMPSPEPCPTVGLTSEGTATPETSPVVSDGTASAEAGSLTSATSGDAAATGVEADNDITSAQVAQAGSQTNEGAVVADNEAEIGVVEAGAAGAETGFAGAIGGDAQAAIVDGSTQITSTASSGQVADGADVETELAGSDEPGDELDGQAGGEASAVSVTTSSSGDAEATGVEADNDVTSVAVASALVTGENHGVVLAQTNTEIIVENVGIGASTSGQSTAQGGDALASVGAAVTGVATAVPAVDAAVAGGEALTEDVTVVGTTGDHEASSEQTIEGVIGGASSGPLRLISDQEIVLANQGSALAVSEDATAGPTDGALATATARPTPLAEASTASSETTSSSGDAEATGVKADNEVTTVGVASVAVLGDNFSLISVIINTVVSIINVGQGEAETGGASATGGDAVAGGQAQPGAGSTGAAEVVATSGDAAATGVSVNNSIEMTNRTQIVVEGDNYNPLTIVVNLFAGIFNIGMAGAQSGDATSRAAGDNSGSSNSAASSGSATAIGVEAENDINLAALVDLRVNGSNYAPINVVVNLFASIFNFGKAQAVTGDAAASGAPAVALGAEAGTENRPASLAATGGSSASSGPGSVGTIGKSIVAVESLPNTSSSETSNNITGGLGSEVSVNQSSTEPNGDQSALPGTWLYEAVAVSGTLARSGDATSIGVASDTSMTNAQAASTGSGSGSGLKIAQNRAELVVDSIGLAVAESGNAATGSVTDVTPMPNDNNSGNKSDGQNSSDVGWGGFWLRAVQFDWLDWPYPDMMWMPSLVRNTILNNSNGASPRGGAVNQIRDVDIWVSQELPRPEGLLTWLQAGGPLPMPNSFNVGNQAGQETSVPPWSNIMLVFGGVASVVGLTSYRYRRQLKPIVNSLVSALSSFVSSLI